MDLGSLLGGLADDAQGQGKGDPSQDQLADMLGALLGGAAPQGGQPQPNLPQQGGDQVLGSLSDGIGDAPMIGGAGAPQGGGFPSGGGMPQGGDPLSDLLGGLMGGTGGQGGMPQGGGGLGDLLGGLMGGGGAQGGQGGDPMGGLLGGLLGGMMGGGIGGASPQMGGAGGMNSMLAPIADMLSEKLGISREIAMTALAVIVPIVMNKLMSGNQQGGDMQRQGLSFSRDEQDEMIGQLTAQTGMDEQSAVATVNQTLAVLGSQQ